MGLGLHYFENGNITILKYYSLSLYIYRDIKYYLLKNWYIIFFSNGTKEYFLVGLLASL